MRCACARARACCCCCQQPRARPTRHPTLPLTNNTKHPPPPPTNKQPPRAHTRVLQGAARERGAALCGPDRDPAQLDVLPLLRHGRALGQRRRERALLGLCQPDHDGRRGEPVLPALWPRRQRRAHLLRPHGQDLFADARRPAAGRRRLAAQPQGHDEHRRRVWLCHRRHLLVAQPQRRAQGLWCCCCCVWVFGCVVGGRTRARARAHTATFAHSLTLPSPVNNTPHPRPKTTTTNPKTSQTTNNRCRSARARRRRRPR